MNFRRASYGPGLRSSTAKGTLAAGCASARGANPIPHNPAARKTSRRLQWLGTFPCANPEAPTLRPRSAFHAARAHARLRLAFRAARTLAPDGSAPPIRPHSVGYYVPGVSGPRESPAFAPAAFPSGSGLQTLPPESTAPSPAEQAVAQPPAENPQAAAPA